jgi:hypothetical protein
MRALRTIVISIVLSAAAFGALAQTAGTADELPFTITGATVQTFDKPRPARTGKYTEALVLQVEVSIADYAKLPLAPEAFLYLGTHELRPIAFKSLKDRLTITYHDPKWQELQGGEPMVLTTLDGDPIVNPEKYKGYPRFDPRVIQ